MPMPTFYPFANDNSEANNILRPLLEELKKAVDSQNDKLDTEACSAPEKYLSDNAFYDYINKNDGHFIEHRSVMQYIHVPSLHRLIAKSESSGIYTILNALAHAYKYGNIKELYAYDIEPLRQLSDWIASQIETCGNDQKIRRYAMNCLKKTIESILQRLGAKLEEEQ